jgi:hypothetical protein
VLAGINTEGRVESTRTRSEEEPNQVGAGKEEEGSKRKKTR